jgi:hypothetical protein
MHVCLSAISGLGYNAATARPPLMEKQVIKPSKNYLHHDKPSNIENADTRTNKAEPPWATSWSVTTLT